MSNNFFEVLRPGINTTYQDKGRFGMQHLGVAPSGCMDHKSFLIANALVSNNEEEGVLEFAYQGPLLKLIKGKTKFAITGNVLFQIINSKNEIINGDCNRSYDLDEGDQIDILATRQSVYGYLSVEGGFEVAPFCNSISILARANIGPNEGKKININTQLKTKGSLTKRRGLVLSNALISNKLSSNYSGISEQIFNSQKHLVVQSVEAGVASGKLRSRDIIMYVDGKEIKDLDDLYAYLKNKEQAEFFLRKASFFNDKIVFYDRYEKVKIEDLKFLEFDK